MFALRHLFFGFLVYLFVYFQARADVFEGRRFAISAASAEATQAAKKIYARGGNIIDAAVAASLSMSVTNPYFAALGGGGFALVKWQNKIEALDFRESSPRKISSEDFANNKEQSSVTGGLAVAVPGLPAGLWELHQKYGKLAWSQLFDDAIHHADKGFQLHGDFVERLQRNWSRLNPKAQNLFGGAMDKVQPGQIHRQKELGKALRFLRQQGAKDFYEGRIAKDLVDSVQKAGGVIDLQDLKNYQVRWRQPAHTNYQGFKIHMMPLPSSGSVVMTTALHLMEKWKLQDYEAFSTAEIHLLAEIFSRSYRARLLLADPDFSRDPSAKLLDKDNLDKLATTISPYKSLELKPIDESSLFPESTETTHLSLIDAEGNAVAMTLTLNASFGSGIYSETYGINLNNEMDDFTTRPGVANQFGLIQSSSNQPEPGKRPLSSMTPTIVESSTGETRLVLGSPGGPRIISSILQVLHRHLVQGFPIDAAVAAPRFHHQFLPHKLYYEKYKVFPQLLTELQKKGHSLEESWAGKVYAVSKETEALKAAYDPRLPGAADGF